MSTYQLTKTRFREGLWEGLLSPLAPDAPAPDIAVTLHDRPVTGVTVSATTERGRFVIEIPVPVEAVGDGVQTFLIQDRNSGEVLESFTLMAGEVIGDDLRAEVGLLRAELDMFKRAFRRHCLETM